MSESSNPAIELQLIPESSDFASNDSRWQNQVSNLLGDLRRNAGEVRREITPMPGQKGGAEAIILALGTSGAISAAVATFRHWLGRSSDRTLRIKATVGERRVEIEVDGKNITESTLRLALGLARE